MNTIENQIWDTITNSAKKKFDYTSFEEGFEDYDENIAENILFKIIASYAANEKDETIAAIIFNDLLITGFVIDKNVLDSFLVGKKELFKVEIYCTQFARDLLQDGNSNFSVLNSINKLLN